MPKTVKKSKDRLTLGILLPIGDTHYGFYKDVLARAQANAVDKGYGFLTFVPQLDRAPDWKEFYKQASGMCDGFLVVSPRTDDAFLAEMRKDKSKKPAVLLFSRSLYFSSVCMDNEHAAAEAVRHLVGLGHKRIATITGDLGTNDGKERLKAFREALNSHGLAAGADWVFEGDFSRDAGRKAMLGFLKLSQKPSAIFSANDNMALGAMEICKQKNVSIPEDLAIVGCDGVLPTPESFKPLTTLRQPMLKIAETGTALLLDMIKSGSLKRQDVLVQGDLKLGGTSAPGR